MTQVIGLFGHMRSGNNYYKRMTFLYLPGNLYIPAK